MNMPNKRLEYEPFKAVLQSLDPNLRIQLALRIPSMRTVDKVVPIKINNLATGDHKIKINDREYSVGVYRQYHNPDQTPQLVQEANERGGMENDIDEWGFLTDPYENLTEGDIAVRTNLGNWSIGSPENERMYATSVITLREALRRKLERDGLEPQYIIPELRELPNSRAIIALNEPTVQYFENLSYNHLQSVLKQDENSLLPYYYRRNNTLPPYSRFIQLTIEGPNGKVVERVEHSKRLSEAMKYLNNKFFGGRRHSICVKELSLVNHSMTLRFPGDMRIRVRQIQTYSIDFEKVDGLIDPASYPLEILTVESLLEDSNTFSHGVVRSAKKLVILNYFTREPWIPSVQNMKNECVILKYQTEIRESQHYINLIENWLESERATGTTLTIGFKRQDTSMDILRLIRNHFEVIKRSERSLTLPMKNGPRLLVNCEQFENDLEFKNNAEFYTVTNREMQPEWAFKLVVA